MNAPRKIAAVSFAAMALLLTGCSAGGTATADDVKAKATEQAVEVEVAADQSKDEACEIVKTTLVELQGLASVDTSDMNAAVEAFKGAEATVREAAGQVSNADVKPVIDGAATAMGEYVVFIDGVVADPANADLTAMSEHLTKLQTSTVELTTVCA